jgi:hypothetical protein
MDVEMMFSCRGGEGVKALWQLQDAHCGNMTWSSVAECCASRPAVRLLRLTVLNGL